MRQSVASAAIRYNFDVRNEVSAICRLCILILTGLLWGCGKPDEPGQAVVESPRDAYLVLLRSMKDANPDRILAITQTTEDQKAAVLAGVEFSKAMMSFRDELIATYGRDGWEQFEDRNRRPGEYDAYFAIIDDAEIDRAKTATINQGEKDANCLMPNGIGRVWMLKTEAGWQIDGRTFLPDGQPPKEVVAKVKDLTAVIRKYQQAIGKPGLTVGDIDAELGRAMDEVLLGRKLDAPRRFDIDKLVGPATSG